MLKHIAVALALSGPVVAFGATQEINAACGQTVRDFFAPLIQQNLINPKPARVTRAVNVFNPRLLKPLTAFGLPVIEVVGITDDPLLFVSTGAPHAQDVYGVVVRDGIGNVQAHLNSIGMGDARVMRVEEKKTLILCKGEM